MVQTEPVLEVLLRQEFILLRRHYLTFSLIVELVYATLRAQDRVDKLVMRKKGKQCATQKESTVGACIYAILHCAMKAQVFAKYACEVRKN